ncbi:PI-PLC X domain-containing protein 1-like [Diretmus argenteus]
MATAGEGRTERYDYSDWMSALPEQLQNIPLWNLAIPGIHDAMSYDLDVNSSIMEPDVLIKLSKLPCVRQIVYKLAITQESTIREQLDAGIRYFDLRIARKPKDSNPTRVYFSHGLYTRTDVETVLKDVNDWAERHPKEILILALSHFRGIDEGSKEQIHSHLINFIKTLFGAKLFPRLSLPMLLEWVKKQTPGAGKTSVNIIASDLVVNYEDFAATVIKLNDKML